jgi:hypothetical protein
MPVPIRPDRKALECRLQPVPSSGLIPVSPTTPHPAQRSVPITGLGGFLAPQFRDGTGATPRPPRAARWAGDN